MTNTEYLVAVEFRTVYAAINKNQISSIKHPASSPSAILSYVSNGEYSASPDSTEKGVNRRLGIDDL